jgi:hypothetical protein
MRYQILDPRDSHAPSRRWRHLVVLLLASAFALGTAADSQADVVLRRRVVRHVPDDATCPFRAGYDLWFYATAATAKITFKGSPTSSQGTTLELSDLHVVEEQTFEANFRADPFDDEECYSDGGAPAFQSSGPSSSDIFLPLGNVSGWTGFNAQLASNALRLGIQPLQASQASYTVSGLTPGLRYFVTGWSNWTDGTGFDVEVDLPRPSAVFLQSGRFKLEVRFDRTQEIAGGGTFSGRSAAFWFRDPLKLELVINVVDRCSDAGTFFVTLAGTTAAEAKITITDQRTGKRLTVQNPAGQRFKPLADQTTFRCQ